MISAMNYIKTMALNSTRSGEQTEDHIFATVADSFPSVTWGVFDAAIDSMLDSGELESTMIHVPEGVPSRRKGYALIAWVPALRRAS